MEPWRFEKLELVKQYHERNLSAPKGGIKDLIGFAEKVRNKW